MKNEASPSVFMITQADLVAPNMPGQAPLRRSSWKADAIRKGHLKISGPIPITEDVPLNDEEEKDFAEKQKLEDPLSPTSHANNDDLMPHGDNLQQHEPTPLQPSPNLPDSHAAPLQESIRPVEQDAPQASEEERHHQPPPPSQSKPQSPPPQQQQQQQQSSPQQQSHLAPSTQGDMDSNHRRSATEPVLYSTPSPYPSVPDSSPKTTPKKKRKSGLRSAFRKMFGRKDRNDILEEEEEEAATTKPRGHNHTTSVSLLSICYLILKSHHCFV